MNFEILQHFTETVRLKSIAKASERLNLTPPALGKQLRRLEAYYGVTLLRRTPAGVEPTEAGVLLLEQIGPLLQEHERLRAELAGYRGTRTLRIGTLPSLAAHYLPSKAVALEQAGIKAEIAIRPTSDELHALLDDGELDAGICESPQRNTFWHKSLFTEPFYAVLPRNHRLAAADTVPLDELAGESFVMYPAACRIRQCVTGAFRAEGMEPKVKSEVPFGDYLLGYVAAGGGATIVPESVAGEMQNPLLQAVRIDDSRTRRTISLLAAEPETGKRLRPFFR